MRIRTLEITGSLNLLYRQKRLFGLAMLPRRILMARHFSREATGINGKCDLAIKLALFVIKRRIFSLGALGHHRAPW